MPGPKPRPIKLTESARISLKKLVSQHTITQQLARRGRIILLAETDKTNVEIAKQLSVSTDMVRLWRRRWLELQPIAENDLTVEERLTDLPRPGTPARLTADQICQIERVVCEQPEKSGRPISQWTGREIAEEMVKRGIVDHISTRHASRLLKKMDSDHT